MKEHDNNLTLQETEQLCRMYMDCRLSVLEETELQYLLGRLPYSSPCIDEVRILMGLPVASRVHKTHKRSFHFRRNRNVISIAASIAILFVIGIFMLLRHSDHASSSLTNGDGPLYIAAYRHGERLNGSEAIAATNVAMAKADSLMRYASLTEQANMMKANDIISLTTNN